MYASGNPRTGLVMAEYMSVAASETATQVLSPQQFSRRNRRNKNLPHTVLPTKLREDIPV